MPLLDLHAWSEAYYNGIGQAAAAAHNPKEGDVTHLNNKGVQVVAQEHLDLGLGARGVA